MKHLEFRQVGNIGVIALARGKVNAIDEDMVSELDGLTGEMAANPDVKALVLTGAGKFFSFGWDVPALYDYAQKDFVRFMRAFCRLCRDLFLFPKPLVAAINGHAMAGGYILALTCDYRLMVDGPAKLSLNEVTFGSTIPVSTVEMLRYAAGNRAAETVLLTGRMFEPLEALRFGLVDRLAPPEILMGAAEAAATDMARHVGPAYASLKRLIKGPMADSWLAREEDSIREFADIWYSPQTREMLKGIQIRA
jgi:enoyl-CoA hydratase/carnithine racemase